jgi:hypothetical protein
VNAPEKDRDSSLGKRSYLCAVLLGQHGVCM